MEHTHKTEDGTLLRCYHECKNFLLDWRFAVATTVAFPLEHAIWTMTPLKHVAEWLGLFGPHLH